MDKLNKKKIQIKGNYVINCTGVFSDKIRKMANPELKQKMICS